MPTAKIGGSLLLPRKALSSSILCRFIPALRQLFLRVDILHGKSASIPQPDTKAEVEEIDVFWIGLIALHLPLF
jgi:hypothetical protein